jgi:hypothetical protein
LGSEDDLGHPRKQVLNTPTPTQLEPLAVDLHMVAGSYLGKEAAEEAFEDAQAFLERDRAELGGEAR